jgi:uncharacterized protein DUF4112
MSSISQIHRAPHAAGGHAALEFLRDITSGMSHEERLVQVRWLARLMDDNFRIPGTTFRFGWDSVLGLFPGLGDVLTGAVSLLIVHHAWQTGAPKLTLARMLANVGIDFVAGAVPFLGDLFDFAFKANRRNARLLEQHLHKKGNKIGFRQTDLCQAERPLVGPSGYSSHSAAAKAIVRRSKSRH